MSRSISDALKVALFSQQTDEIFLLLLTIDHDDLPDPLRFTTDSINTTSGGDTFLSYPFQINLPVDAMDRPPEVQVVIDNIDRSLVAAIRGLTTAPTVTMEIVRASDPDTIEATFPDFQMTKISYNSLTIIANLSMEAFVTEPYPAGSFNPANFPGLFDATAGGGDDPTPPIDPGAHR